MAGNGRTPYPKEITSMVSGAAPPLMSLRWGVDGTILHYDGSTWSGMSSGTTNDLEGVWGSSPSDIFAVGERGTILHYGQQDGEAGPGTVSSDSGISVWVWVGIALGATLIGVVVLILMRRRSTAL